MKELEIVTKRKIELLAPGGDVDSIKAAILAGANAVYCGLDQFNARNRAANISFENLQGILHLAHSYNCEVFLTLNIIIIEREIPALISLLNKLVNTSIDGVIVQDLGMLYLLRKYFKSLNVHASTQLTNHNSGQIKFLSKLSSTRVNLSRELNIHEIQHLTSVAHENNVLTEVFVHGSNCISFSGICYISSVLSGNSGNRGRCSQPCRDQYITTAAGKNYPLNLKDNSAFFDLKELYEAGVDSLKIEGRIKKYAYVYTVVDAWRKQLDTFHNQNKIGEDNSHLYKVFNRDFSDTLLKGEISKNMFIDNPRDHSIKHLSEINSYASADEVEAGQLKLYQEKEEIKALVEAKINQLSAKKVPLQIHLSGECGTPLKVSVTTPERTFVVHSECDLLAKGTQPLDYEMVLKRFKAFNDTEYFIEEMSLEEIKADVYISFKELTSLKKRILYLLNGSKESLEPVQVPAITNLGLEADKPSLSVLISSEEDIYLTDETKADIYFQLPNCFKDKCSDFTDLFTRYKKLIPYFPSVIIGEDYSIAVEFLKQLKPKLIVTNNTGIAYEAYQLGIDWIAGPHLNIVNSYSLLALKEALNCSGAFISNELNRNQIKGIKKPTNFKLHYSIYHPIVLMTSRQCLFHQVTGCEKNRVDDTCIQACEKSSSIINLKKESFMIEKSKGNYHTIYNQNNFLNTEILNDLPAVFSSFMIDLRDVKTETKLASSKSELIQLFENRLEETANSETILKKVIQSTTNKQYKKGI
ncbi:U32 family peptidase [Labilibaculum antarcticum]|uniref:Peptidase U32 n=1 Tax=Labilibaculum antarcticum TaxID=1717717 RepID=A0A1Y1CEC7_9BACT|nr:U32 family peptidase [Labilibaculum antarcticum]BAX78697.1 peptidase U32 [Labilibaculum antarcticum]